MTRKLCEIFNEFFGNAISNLNIPEFTGKFDQSGIVVSACPIINAIVKYENHPSLTKIRNKHVSYLTFSFFLFPVRIVKKENIDIFYSFNKTVIFSQFPSTIWRM